MDIIKGYSLNDTDDQITIVFEEASIYVYSKEANVCFSYKHLIQISTYQRIQNPTLLTLRVTNYDWQLQMYVYPKDITGQFLMGHITWLRITCDADKITLNNYYRIDTSRNELEEIILKYYPQ